MKKIEKHIAFDGKEFSDIEQCANYELTHKIEQSEIDRYIILYDDKKNKVPLDNFDIIDADPHCAVVKNIEKLKELCNIYEEYCKTVGHTYNPFQELYDIVDKEGVYSQSWSCTDWHKLKCKNDDITDKLIQR